jgi:hypothetical protein
MPRPGRFSRGNDKVPIVVEAEWVPGRLLMGAENLASTGFRSPDRPGRSGSYIDLDIAARKYVKKRFKKLTFRLHILIILHTQ